MARITSKREFYARAAQGLCGNTPRTWSTVAEWLEAKCSRVGLRTLTPGDPRGMARVIPYRAVYLMETFPGVWYISEIPPRGGSEGRGFQGEFTWVNGAWWLYYSTQMGYMRTALRDSGRHAYGWEALRLLRGHLDPDDYGALMELFDYYTEGDDYPVVEFANFREPWGRLGRRLIIWEIRNGY